MRPYDPTDIFCARRRHRREIHRKREFGKVIIESEVTLQNPDMMVALFMLMIMKGCTW
jgi:hypothetical protein